MLFLFDAKTRKMADSRISKLPEPWYQVDVVKLGLGKSEILESIMVSLIKMDRISGINMYDTFDWK